VQVVSIEPRSFSSVFRPSRLLGLAFALAAGLGSTEAEAQSAVQHATPAPPRATAPAMDEARAEERYGLPLATSYVLAPALAGIAGAGVFELTESSDVAVAAGALMLALPAAVHAYYTEPGRALLSFGSMLGVTLIGAALLGSAGYLLGNATCERGTPAYEAEGCGVQIEAMTMLGMGAGAVLGYAGYAVYDVNRNASVPATSEQVGAPLLWVRPLAGSAREGKPPTELVGAALVATFQL
jgi:hypothetical protein